MLGIATVYLCVIETKDRLGTKLDQFFIVFEFGEDQQKIIKYDFIEHTFLQLIILQYHLELFSSHFDYHVHILWDQLINVVHVFLIAEIVELVLLVIKNDVIEDQSHQVEVFLFPKIQYQFIFYHNVYKIVLIYLE